MKLLLPLITALVMCSPVSANNSFLGTWSSSAKEVLKISNNGDSLVAEFVRESVKAQFEKVRFPAKISGDALIITGEQGDLSARYDAGNQLLILGGIKAFQKVTADQAQQLIANLENK